MKLKTLSGISLYPIGIGTWDIGSRRDYDTGIVEAVYGNEEKEIEAIRYSISKGQNYINSAELYGRGHTDKIIGQAISFFERKDLYVADMLWKNSVKTGRVEKAVMAMLRRLDSDYIDLLYIHSPWDDAPWLEAIQQIDELIDKGIVRHFGVSNFNISQIKQAMRLSHHAIAAIQLHFNVLNKRNVFGPLQAFCKEQDIELVAYRPVERTKVLHNKTIQTVAQAHEATPAQVALAWLIHHQALPIPKAIQKKHIDQNVAAPRIKLSPAEVAILDRI